MSTEDIRKKVEQEKKSAQEREDRERKEYFSLSTVKEWDGMVVNFSKRIFSELFPESWSGPKIIYRMKYWEGYWGGVSSGGSPSHYSWSFRGHNIELGFAVYSPFGIFDSGEWKSKDPNICRGKLHTHNSQSYVNTKLRSWVEDYNRGNQGRIFSSPSELEAAFDDIFEYFYRKKSSQE